MVEEGPIKPWCRPNSSLFLYLPSAMAGPRRLVLLFSLLFNLFLSAWSKLVTRTIDDGYDNSDHTLKHALHFFPEKNGHWGSSDAGVECTADSRFCLPVDSSKCFAQTWTATALYSTPIKRSIVIDFVGMRVEYSG